jgi:hypothetical protein
MGMPSNKNQMVPNADSNSKPKWPYVRTFDTPHQAGMVHEQLHMFSQSQTIAPIATAHSARKPSHNTTSHAPWQQGHAMSMEAYSMLKLQSHHPWNAQSVKLMVET